MSDNLTDADLWRLDHFFTEKNPSRDGRLLVAEIRRLRAVVGAHPTGPDQDEFAAWLISDQRGPHNDSRPWATTNAAEAKRHWSHGCTVTPLRACEAQATAPRADEDAVEHATEFIAGTVAWRFGNDDDREEWRDEARGVLAAAYPLAAAPGAETTTRPSGWVELVRDHVGEDDEDTHDGPAVVEPPC